MFLEYVTLGVYLIFLLLLGVIFSKFNRNLSDFVRGGAQATWWLAGVSMLMSGISAFTFTGNASAAFDAGPTVLVLYAANSIALAVCGCFLGAWFRQTRAYTSADLIRTRFSTTAEQFGVYFGLVMNPIYSAVQLWALAVFASSVFGFEIIPTILVIGSIVVFYSTTGGKWAVLATDFVQGMVLLSITILVAILSLIKVGGLGEFFSYFSDARFVEDFKFVKDPGQFPQDKFSWTWIVAVSVLQFKAYLSLGSATQYLVVKDGREARRAAWLACALMVAGSLIWFMPPMVARFLYEEAILAQDIANPSNFSYAYIAREVLPNGLMGIMIAAMFSATMSSMDTGLNGQVGTIVRNLIPRLRSRLGFHDELNPKTQLIICRITTPVLGAIVLTYSCLFAAQDKVALFDTFLVIGSIVGLPMSFPALVGLWVKRIPSWSFFWIAGWCMVPSLVSFYDSKFNDYSWSIQERVFWILLAGTMATLTCMPFFKFSSDRYRERILNFFKQMHTPVDYAREIGQSRDYSQLFLIGNTLLVMGGAILLLMLLPNPTWGRLCIAFVAGFQVTVGFSLKWGARREKRKERELLDRVEEDQELDIP